MQSKMSLGDHLEEFRRCLLYSLAGLGLALILTFYLGFYLIDWLAQPLLQSQVAHGYTPQTITLDPTAGFVTVYLPVSLIGALILASPWVLYQLWRFISAGLYAHERRVIYILAPFSSVMTLLAVLFTYYILLPICLMFFLNWSTYYPTYEPREPGWLMRSLSPSSSAKSPIEVDSEMSSPVYATQALSLPVLAEPPVEPKEGMLWINKRTEQIQVYLNGQTRIFALSPNRLLAPTPDLGWFVKFASFMMLGVVLAFQLPVLMLVAGWTGLVSPVFLAQFRRYALFGAFIIGAILTPTDLLSMFVLALPMYALFELGLWLMRLVYPEPTFDDQAAEE